jgi:hypothetical protein
MKTTTETMKFYWLNDENQGLKGVQRFLTADFKISDKILD